MSVDQVCDCLEKFQLRVNELTESEFLQFTCEIWMPDAPETLEPKKQESQNQQESSIPVFRHGILLAGRRFEIQSPP